MNDIKVRWGSIGLHIRAKFVLGISTTLGIVSAITFQDINRLLDGREL